MRSTATKSGHAAWLARCGAGKRDGSAQGPFDPLKFGIEKTKLHLK